MTNLSNEEKINEDFATNDNETNELFYEPSHNDFRRQGSLEPRLANLLLNLRDMKGHSISEEEWEDIEEAANPQDVDDEWEEEQESSYEDRSVTVEFNSNDDSFPMEELIATPLIFLGEFSAF